MVFKCQEDSFLTEFSSKILSCEKSTISRLVEGKKQIVDGYDIILENTILFPEGGGQPCDTGVLNSVEVIQVTRRGTQAVHFTTIPFNVGDTVDQKLNWPRRLDHMQQHSGQHLLSAVLERDYNWRTTSWWLGEEISYVELDTKAVTVEQMEAVETLLNNYIRKQISVTVKIFEFKEALDNQSRQFVKSLPADHVGPVRLIEIEGIDSNLCCGTHVSNLSQLQCIKLVSTEKGKQGKVNLNFLVGNRVMKQLQNCTEREQNLTALLKGGPSKHYDLISKLQSFQKLSTKHLSNLLKYVAALEAEKLLQQDPRPKFFSLHSTEATDFPEFMSTFIKEVATTDILLLLTVGNDKGSGNVVLHGDEKLVQKLGPELCAILDGRGAGKGSKFQAKVNNLKNIDKCIELISKEFE